MKGGPPASLLALGVGTLLFSAAAILFGAPLEWSYMPGTLLWASLLSFFAVLPAAFLFGSDWTQWHRLFILFRVESRLERVLLWLSHGALLGAWVGAWPIPLDWDAPWQVWPISSLYGIAAGLSVSIVGEVLTR